MNQLATREALLRGFVGVWYNNEIGKAASYYTIPTLHRRLFITAQKQAHLKFVTRQLNALIGQYALLF